MISERRKTDYILEVIGF